MKQKPSRSGPRFLTSGWLWLFVVFQLQACASVKQGDDQNENWLTLFDGTSLTKWRGYQQQGVPPEWQIQDGVLTLTAGGGGDLITVEQFGAFDLRMEWRIAPGGNSGVFVLADEALPRIYIKAPEVQILDDARHPDNKLATHRSGSLYDLVAAPPSAQRAAGEWNTLRVVFVGQALSVWQNDVVVVRELDLNSQRWADLVADSKFESWPGFGENRRGHIGLQDHGDVVSFRNIRIRNLDIQP